MRLLIICCALLMIQACSIREIVDMLPRDMKPMVDVSNGASLTDGDLGLVHNGKRYVMPNAHKAENKIATEIVENRTSTSVFLGVDGRYVRALMVGHADHMDPSQSFQNYGVEGKVPVVFPLGVRQFEGEYVAAAMVDGQPMEINEKIELTADFDSGAVIGNGIERGSEVLINGSMNGHKVDFRVVDELGDHDGNGGFFGPEADEFLGAYVEENASGMIYASQ